MTSWNRDRAFLTYVYRKATLPTDLPWFREELPPLLRKILNERKQAATALDIGCGSGEIALYLAKSGLIVTAVDYLKHPLVFARSLAASNGFDIKFVQSDILQWQSDEIFDVIVDLGCLHHIGSHGRATYRRRLLTWLAPNGDYLLSHFIKSHRLDWRPFGPRRRTTQQIRHFFAPDLIEQEGVEETITGVDLPVGPTVQIGTWWFKRPPG